MPSFDFLIVGSGIAGLFAALLAREHGTVVILTKGKIDDCNSRYAQGGVAAAVGPSDSPELHMQDTLAAGAGLCDPEAVRVLTQEGPERIADLIRLGVSFDTVHGEIALARKARTKECGPLTWDGSSAVPSWGYGTMRTASLPSMA